MVKRIQREVTLSITQRHDFVRIIYYVWQCLTYQNTIVVLTRFRPFIKYNTFYNGDIYQHNARQHTILTVRLFTKFNTFYHNDNYNA
jgi:hypothetical protein